MMSLSGNVEYKGFMAHCECGHANWRLRLQDNVLTAFCGGCCKRYYLIHTTCSGLVSFINPNNQEAECQKTSAEDATPPSEANEDSAESASSDAAPSASQTTHDRATIVGIQSYLADKSRLRPTQVRALEQYILLRDSLFKSSGAGDEDSIRTI